MTFLIILQVQPEGGGGGHALHLFSERDKFSAADKKYASGKLGEENSRRFRRKS